LIPNFRSIRRFGIGRGRHLSTRAFDRQSGGQSWLVEMASLLSAGSVLRLQTEARHTAARAASKKPAGIGVSSRQFT